MTRQRYGPIYREKIAEEIAQLETRIRTEITTPVEARIYPLKRDMYTTKRNVLKMKSNEWKNQQVWTNVISVQCEILGMAIAVKHDYACAGALEEIEEAIKQAGRGGSWETKLVQVLKDLPDNFGSVRDRIDARLRSFALACFTRADN